MPDSRTEWSHPAAWPDEELLAECDFAQGKTSGPGGQHRNKVETAVFLTHRPSGISSHAGERRSMIDNKRVALRRLRLALATRLRQPVPDGEIGSKLWRSRRRRSKDPASGGKIECNPDHRDYPSLLAEALDVIAAAGWDTRTAGIRLEVSPSQLLKLIKQHPAAFARLNESRRSQGLRAFH